MATTTGRFYSLDVFRGLAIATMLFLDAPPDKIYSILEHAEWAGFTVPDAPLPIFAFAMGAGAAISMSKREPSARRILTRAAIMFAVGLFIFFTWKIFELIFVSGFTFENFYDLVIVHGRLFGIIQRLAVTYAAAIFIARALRSDTKILIAAFVLLILSTAGFYIYSPVNPYDEAHNISRAVDYIFPGANHIYTPTHDPEGLYGAIAGTSSVLFGFLAGRILIDSSSMRDKILKLIAGGIILLIIGGLWSNLDIVSKKLWTSSYTLLNAGGDAILLALLTKLFDCVPSAEKFFRPLKALGTNPLFFFTANCLVLIVLTFVPSPTEGLGIYMWLFENTTKEFISTEFGATLFCVIWFTLWLPIAEFFYRRGIVIKI
ncbi:MAG: hypothetical protein K6G55_06500 [Selenomonadaceae bacterium]|nr:hypothetical protein [Selenomonadaceae bacterium]